MLHPGAEFEDVGPDEAVGADYYDEAEPVLGCHAGEGVVCIADKVSFPGGEGRRGFGVEDLGVGEDFLEGWGGFLRHCCGWVGFGLLLGRWGLGRGRWMWCFYTVEESFAGGCGIYGVRFRFF